MNQKLIRPISIIVSVAFLWQNLLWANIEGFYSLRPVAFRDRPAQKRPSQESPGSALEGNIYFCHGTYLIHERSMKVIRDVAKMLRRKFGIRFHITLIDKKKNKLFSFKHPLDRMGNLEMLNAFARLSIIKVVKKILTANPHFRILIEGGADSELRRKAAELIMSLLRNELRRPDGSLMDISFMRSRSELQGLPQEYRRYILAKIKEIGLSTKALQSPDKEDNLQADGGGLGMPEHSEAPQREIFYEGDDLKVLLGDQTVIVFEKNGNVRRIIKRTDRRLEEILTILSKDENPELQRRAKLALEKKTGNKKKMGTDTISPKGSPTESMQSPSGEDSNTGDRFDRPEKTTPRSQPEPSLTAWQRLQRHPNWLVTIGVIIASWTGIVVKTAIYETGPTLFIVGMFFANITILVSLSALQIFIINPIERHVGKFVAKRRSIWNTLMRISPKQRTLLLASFVANTGIGSFLFYYAMSCPGISPLIGSIALVFNMLTQTLITRYSLKERMHILNKIGIGIGIAGVTITMVMVAFGANNMTGFWHSSVIPSIFIIASGLFFVVRWALQRSVLNYLNRKKEADIVDALKRGGLIQLNYAIGFMLQGLLTLGFIIYMLNNPSSPLTVLNFGEGFTNLLKINPFKVVPVFFVAGLMYLINWGLHFLVISKPEEEYTMSEFIPVSNISPIFVFINTHILFAFGVSSQIIGTKPSAALLLSGLATIAGAIISSCKIPEGMSLRQYLKARFSFKKKIGKMGTGTISPKDSSTESRQSPSGEDSNTGDRSGMPARTVPKEDTVPKEGVTSQGRRLVEANI